MNTKLKADAILIRLSDYSLSLVVGKTFIAEKPNLNKEVFEKIFL